MQAPLRAIWPPLSLLLVALATCSGFIAAGWWPLSLMLLPTFPILLLDARARGLDYQYALSHLKRGRSPERIAAIFRMSWCMRVACQAAADTAGAQTGRAVRVCNHAEGYRWFHVTPDGTFTRQTPFLNMLFWRITLMGYDKGRRRTAAAPKVVVRNANPDNKASASTRCKAA